MSEDADADLSDPAVYEATRREVRHKMVNMYLHLYLICEVARCRRARRCTEDEAPCLWRYKEQYQYLMPPLHKALKAKLAAQEAEEGQAPTG